MDNKIPYGGMLAVLDDFANERIQLKSEEEKLDSLIHEQNVLEGEYKAMKKIHFIKRYISRRKIKKLDSEIIKLASEIRSTKENIETAQELMELYS